ncbi:DUF255 domain-containing protein, partial [Streptomyces bacillaris]
QHADNPVDWWPWGPEAFEEAKRRDVPVLLSVTGCADARVGGRWRTRRTQNLGESCPSSTAPGHSPGLRLLQ